VLAMDFELINTMVFALYVIGLLCAGFAIVGVIADICRGRPPSRGATIFALSVLVGIGVWSLAVGLSVKALAVPLYDHARHALISLLGFVAGYVACVFIADRLTKVWPAVRNLPEPNNGKVDVIEQEKTLSMALATIVQAEQNIVVPPPPEIRSAMDLAPAIRNPISAFANTVGTNAQISALENAGRLADATARAAEAEAKGFDAIMRREDRLIEMRVRQQIAPELQQNKIEEQRNRLLDDEHHRTIAAERRSKERWDAKRDTTNARHGVEAAKKFKEFKFELGERRARARMADVDVDTATANAASRKLGANPESPDAAATLIDLQDLADGIRQQILSGAAEGQDTSWLREQLARIEGMLPK
jgi:hypothetical protein